MKTAGKNGVHHHTARPDGSARRSGTDLSNGTAVQNGSVLLPNGIAYANGSQPPSGLGQAVYRSRPALKPHSFQLPTTVPHSTPMGG